MSISLQHILYLLAFQLVGFIFYFLQNRQPKVGGAISFIKSLWLIYAIILWMLVPLYFFFATEPLLRYVFIALAISMWLRGLAEVYLCYISKSWRVAYGVGHDFFHLILVVIAFALVQPLQQMLPLFTLLLTALALIVELLFVFWFKRNTGGPQNQIYFVSGDKKFAAINRRTTYLVVPQYIAFYGLVGARFLQYI